jgi:hypothetical protein
MDCSSGRFLEKVLLRVRCTYTCAPCMSCTLYVHLQRYGPKDIKRSLLEGQRVVFFGQ